MAAQDLSFFPVQVGAKQGCVLAPVIFNIFMTAVAIYARNSFLQDNEISVKYRLDGNLFHQRRLNAQSKICYPFLWASVC